MRRMGKFLTWGRLLVGPLALSLFAVGCSRSVAVPDDHLAGQTNPHAAPFHPTVKRPEGVAEETTTENTNPTAPGDHLPFHDGESLPAGTLISVRLNAPISVEDPQASDPFEAVVVEPVMLEGNALIPRGTPVSGRVESARSSKLKRNRGYVRLALASVHLDGADIPVQTASLYARQSPLGDDSPSVIRLEKGRRLTFSLAEPAYLASKSARTNH